MQQHQRPVRVIKRDQRVRGEGAANDAGNGGTEPSEREVRAVVAGWVREHRQLAEEGQRAAAFMLKAARYQLSQAA